MTRTERNQNPAALLKDRHSRSGLNKNEDQRKNGAGAGNWGSYSEQGQYESQANDDAADERDLFDMDGEDEGGDQISPMPKKSSASASAGDGLDGIDAAAKVPGAGAELGQSPSDSMSSLDSNANGNANGDGNGVGVAVPTRAQPVRRMSNVSEEERASANAYRTGLMHKGGVIDLANIAKTSYGIAQSPPNTFSLGSSPTNLKGGFKH